MWEDGLFGGAVHFRGVGYGNIGSFNYSDNAITVCAFVWHDAFRSGQVERYVTMAPEVAVIRKETDGRLHFYIKTDDNLRHLWISDVLTESRWYHVAGTWDGLTQRLYIDGVEIASQTPGGVLGDTSSVTVSSGDEPLNGMLDEIRIYSRALMEQEIKGVMLGGGAEYPYALAPVPENGALHEDTWVSLGWRAGDFAVSHDVYIGENFDDVNAGAEGTFQVNQTSTFYVIGFPGFAYSDGLVPGTTYYWRIDEVNDTEPNSPWKGPVWSFTVPPKTAYFPDPADSAESVEPDAKLRWTPGFGAKLHTVYFGDNFDDVSNAAGGLPQGTTSYDPGTLEMAKTYYWRVDEFDVVETHKGDVWSFTTEGAVGNSSPANGAVDVTQIPILTWTPGVNGASHEVYFGTDKEAVKNADTSSPEYKVSGNLGSESYEPGLLEWNTTYYWRVDEANNTNVDSPWTGPLWSFTTANFLIIDDFESYNDLDPADPASNRIFFVWLDGFDNPAINGSIVGHANPPFAEQNIVHGGLQSMPMAYDNTVGKSEATLTLTSNRDWTVNGVNTLTIWCRGTSSNAAEQMYVVLNGSAVVDNDNPDAAQKGFWNQWNIDLQTFADQGINLANVNSITLGLGNKNNPVAGGLGMMYFDDIRLYAPTP
ncbi:MAG: hypothetical protein GY774_10090 [Planctomycetes bacterium]|nr:hypothetical protein [Planctomycetota bacterium]